MRIDDSTQPFPPAVTDRHALWPAVNDLDDNVLPSLGDAYDPTPPPARESPVVASAHPSTRVTTGTRLHPEEYAALPPVGDFWGLQNAALQRPADNFTAGTSARPSVRRPVPVTSLRESSAVSLPPYAPPAPRRTVAPAASLALTTGLLAVPMTLALGLGAVLGMIAVVSGAVAIKQINREPAARKGKGRAITGIVCGAGSVAVGGPILLFLALLIGL
ncbi:MULTISPECIES: DUF4190 domain-containing protein [Gordonia]|uniref:DUF4190 domain-containing protein n=1 Tax=Gordonia amicalis TaxID=89053 RepID=A0AAE4R413_9ACTN|nr:MULTISPECIES: DUF4190 domain-containing protein [Gordonia]ATD73220.1 hypothetical protein CNO18_18575 [Gordonia sp. 1D]KAF0970232.1 hypothetical protein BPODLACK_01285 [Gordonia sp. YY1]MDJ0451699.1 DUF4190 domain-containing protein [Gordonia amicalis]MDV6306549.1 DUF4190 domain-containing protein [Gordonia amicalis]MDV6311278.1 DUF4190 domain-containing protein [Gordonia amicalis]